MSDRYPTLCIVQRKKLATKFNSKSIINNELQALNRQRLVLRFFYITFQMSTRSWMEARSHKRKLLRGGAMHSTISMGQVGQAFSRRQQCLKDIKVWSSQG